MKQSYKRVAIIGIVGVPASYGGFESLVENIIGENSSQFIEYTICCSSLSYSQKKDVYKGAKLKYIPLKANGVQSIFYDIISIFRTILKVDVLLILGVSGCIILPVIKLFSAKKIIVNIDGLEHKRDKWKPLVRRFLKWSEKLAVNYADVIISDNKAIQDYVKVQYNKDSELIEYGGDHVLCDVSAIESTVLEQYGLEKMNYSFSVCRIEPENNIKITLDAFSRINENIVFVGNWQNSNYGQMLRKEYSQYKNIMLLDPIYDIKVLNVLRQNCKFYLHGHSAGGTNPSLVEAMFFGKPVLTYDVEYNRETTENKAYYYNDAQSLINLINMPYTDFMDSGRVMAKIAYRRYLWKYIAQKYEALYLED